MATLEDKILGEKRENYCSSSEDDGDDDFHDALDEKNLCSSTVPSTESRQYSNVEAWSGSSANTGPKGVIKDWQRFKQLEHDKREEADQERINLMEKLSIVTSTKSEDDKRMEQDDFDAEFAELMNEENLLQFQRERMMDMLKQSGHFKQFGQLNQLNNSNDFLNAIDQEHKSTTVIVHIYEQHLIACRSMNLCLEVLAKDYPTVKFCKIVCTLINGLSQQFKSIGVPAILIYKGGHLIGNFVRISDDLGGDEFYASDVESFFIEHGMLPDKSHQPIIVQSE